LSYHKYYMFCISIPAIGLVTSIDVFKRLTSMRVTPTRVLHCFTAAILFVLMWTIFLQVRE